MLFLKFVLVVLATVVVLVLFSYFRAVAQIPGMNRAAGQNHGAIGIDIYGLSFDDVAFALVLVGRGRNADRCWLAL